MKSSGVAGIAVMVLAVIFFFIGFYYIQSTEKALLLGHEVDEAGTCSHDKTAVCPFAEINKLSVPKYLGLMADLLLFALGVFLFVQKKEGGKSLEHAKSVAKNLEGEEAQVMSLLLEGEGMMFQNELVEKTGLSKVKITRLLDKLEGKGLVERRRRGMTNVIILK